MFKRHKLFTFLLTIIIVLSLFPTNAAAVNIEPYSIPTITSTTCSHCGYSMDYVRDEIDTVKKTVQSITCPVSPNADPDVVHYHYQRTLYAVYMCSGCSAIGRKYIRYWMDCSLTMGSRSIIIAE